MCCKVLPTANTAPTARWVHEYTPPCPLYPAGATGILEITSYTKRGPVTASYGVDCVLDHGCIVGWEMVNLANDQEYQIDTEWGQSQWECSCGDCTFRSRLCKHSQGLQLAMKQIGINP